MWIDSNSCDNHFHIIEQRDGKWVCLHGDDTECEEVEFGGDDLVSE